MDRSIVHPTFFFNRFISTQLNIFCLEGVINGYVWRGKSQTLCVCQPVELGSSQTGCFPLPRLAEKQHTDSDGIRPDHINSFSNGILFQTPRLSQQLDSPNSKSSTSSVNCCLGCELFLKATNSPHVNKQVELDPPRSLDIQPVEAEDLDTRLCCKTLASTLTPAVK